MAHNKMLLSNLVDERGSLGSATVVPEESGGGEIDADDVIRATTGMSAAQQAAVLGNLGAASAATVTEMDNDLKTVYWESVTVSGTTPTITPVSNRRYVCGELTSLTISNPPATGAYVIKFDSGATATTTTIPASVVFPEAFAAEANTHYEINVEDNYALVASWPISGGGGA